VVRATPPEADDDDHRDDRFFHVVYEDNDKEDLTLAELLPLILPRGANLTTDLSTRPRRALYKKIYATIADTLATVPASFHGSNEGVLRRVFSMPRARITHGKRKAKLNNWSKTSTRARSSTCRRGLYGWPSKPTTR